MNRRENGTCVSDNTKIILNQILNYINKDNSIKIHNSIPVVSTQCAAIIDCECSDVTGENIRDERMEQCAGKVV